MLNEVEIAMLEFERRWWRNPSSKAQAIRDEFGMAPIRYYQLLNQLISRPEALEHDPVLVNTLLRRREG